MTARALPYLFGLVIGVAAALLVLPVETILGVGPGWNPPGADQAQALTGHLALQTDAWRWPPLVARNLFVPYGISIALTDSNPLLSLLAKLWTKATGIGPVNLFGAWLALCWVLQPVAAIFAARGLRLGLVPAVAAGILAAAWPALLVRMGHLNLCAHFMILLALGLTFRRVAERGGWLAPAALLLASVLIQPYIFEISAMVLAAIPLHAAIERRAGWRRDVVWFLLSGVLAVAAVTLLSGPLGGGDRGFVFFSMNLVSPIWPQLSGVFGADLPVIDATGGQYEGYNWLGAGVLLLVLAACAARLVRGRSAPAIPRALLIVLIGLTVFSLSSRIYAGPYKVLDLGAKPWEDIFGTFRTPGRAFWPVGYAVMLLAVAAVARLPRAVAAPVLLAAAALQIVDTAPLRAGGRGAWEHGAPTLTPALPHGTALLTVAPFPGCTPDRDVKAEGPVLLLDAVRHGARTGDVGLGRSPAWFNCERILSDAMELPLEPGEVRAFFTADVQARLRPVLLGPAAACRRERDAVMCGRDAVPIAGEAVPAGAAPADLPMGRTVQGPDLARLLGTGWLVATSGEIWSEGPRGTLLFAVKPGAELTLTLHVAAIAARPGGTREVHASIGRNAAVEFALPDGQPADIVLHLQAPDAAGGLVRVALDYNRPVDPSKRAMTAPVQRAALRLTGIEAAAR